MIRSNNINWHDHSVYTEMTAPSLNINFTDEEELKRIFVHEGLSENFSTYISESKRNIVNETLSQKISADVSEYTILELKEEYK